MGRLNSGFSWDSVFTNTVGGGNSMNGGGKRPSPCSDGQRPTCTCNAGFSMRTGQRPPPKQQQQQQPQFTASAYNSNGATSNPGVWSQFGFRRQLHGNDNGNDNGNGNANRGDKRNHRGPNHERFYRSAHTAHTQGRKCSCVVGKLAPGGFGA